MPWKIGDNVRYIFHPPPFMNNGEDLIYEGEVVNADENYIVIKWKNVPDGGLMTYSRNSDIALNLVLIKGMETNNPNATFKHSKGV
jgi:hypothetical protein